MLREIPVVDELDSLAELREDLLLLSPLVTEVFSDTLSVPPAKSTHTVSQTRAQGWLKAGSDWDLLKIDLTS